MGHARGRNLRAARPRRCDGGWTCRPRCDCRGARPYPQSPLSAAACALDAGYRDRADTRALHPHAARSAAQLAFAEQHPHHGNLPQRLFRRHVDASRRRSRRRAHRLRGAQGRAVLRMARAQSRRGPPLRSHDARGARAGDAGDRRGVRLLVVRTRGGCRRRQWLAVVGRARRLAEPACDPVRHAGSRCRGETRGGRPASRRALRECGRFYDPGARRGRRLSHPPSPARLRGRRLRAHPRQCASRHAAARARAGARSASAVR